MPPEAGVARYAGDWIEGFLDYTSHINSPEIFRLWTAISILSAVQERKTWIKTSGRRLFPNLYTLLVAPPGVGKTETIKSVYEFAYELKDFFLASSDCSSASIMDDLYDAKRSILRPTEVPPLETFNAMTIASDELGVFLKQYDNAFMSKLNKLFDGTPFTENKRGRKEKLIIERPIVNFLAGTTPGWLGSNLPLSAWSEGFTSRLIMVYSGERLKTDPFADHFTEVVQFEKLFKDLQVVQNLHGQFHWMEDVIEAYKKWYFADMPPIPEHPRLEHYLPRRPIHFMKVMMACSVSRSNEMILRMEDYQRAQNILLMTEEYMPDVFKSMSMSADSNVIDEVFAYVYNTWVKEKQKPIKQHRIINFIKEKVPVHSVIKILDTMVQSRMIKVAEVDGTGNHGYVPIPRAEHGR
jgi:hypothetical protein